MRSHHTLLWSSFRSLPCLLALAVLSGDAASQGSSTLRAAAREDASATESATVSPTAITSFPGALAEDDSFGHSLAFLGDLDGDGRIEVAAGAPGDDSGGVDGGGAVYILSLHGLGSVAAVRKIAPGEGGFTGEQGDDYGSGFGWALAALGDLDGDGVGDLAVGAYFEGSVWILFLRADGTVRAEREIAGTSASFGADLALLGDLDGDGRPELAVGHPQDGGMRGTVSILSLDPDGGVHAGLTLGQGLGGFGGMLDPNDSLGSALARIPDLDDDGVPELAVGATGDGNYTGAVWVLFLNADGTVRDERKITRMTGGFTGRIPEFGYFGLGLAALDDANGDDLPELAVGALGTEDYTGNVWILFLDSSGAVKKHRQIGGTPSGKFRATSGFEGELSPFGAFGGSLALLDDRDGDGVRELAIGASGEPTEICFFVGALWLLYMDGKGGVQHERMLAPDGGLPIPVEPRTLASAAALGDLDGNGRIELALGAGTDCVDSRGSLWIAQLAEDEKVASVRRIGAESGGFTGFLADGDRFGAAVAALGDLDLDGVADLAVGTPGSDLRGLDRGVVWILFLEADGRVREGREIGEGLNGFAGTLRNGDGFGSALASAGDLDGDGIAELAVGAPGDDDGGVNRGALWILFLEPDGTVRAAQKISKTQGGFPGTLADNDGFGSALAGLGDVDGDQVPDLAVGAPFHDTEVPDAGVVWTLHLDADGTVTDTRAFDPTQIGHHPRDRDLFGSALAALGDLDFDGELELFVGAPGDDGSFIGGRQGVLWAVTLAPDGGASSQTRFLQAQLGLGNVQSEDRLGAFLAPLPDLNGDGIPELGAGHGDAFSMWVLHQDGLVRAGAGHALPR